MISKRYYSIAVPARQVFLWVFLGQHSSQRSSYETQEKHKYGLFQISPCLMLCKKSNGTQQDCIGCSQSHAPDKSSVLCFFSHIIPSHKARYYVDNHDSQVHLALPKPHFIQQKGKYQQQHACHCIRQEKRLYHLQRFCIS